MHRRCLAFGLSGASYGTGVVRRAIFDTLTYDQGGNNGGGGAVQERASIALIGIALLALRSVRQRQTPKG